MIANTETELTTPAPLLLSLDEARKQLSISERMLWGLCTAGDVPSVRIGQRVLIRATDLHKWIDAGCPHPRWTEQQAAAKLAREANQEDRPRASRRKKKK